MNIPIKHIDEVDIAIPDKRKNLVLEKLVFDYFGINGLLCKTAKEYSCEED